METSKLGNAVYLEVGVRFDEDHGHIHLTAKNVHGFHTTVTNNPASKRGHPNLFAKLAKVLKEAGAPHPKIKEAEADETAAEVDKIMERTRTPPEFR